MRTEKVESITITETVCDVCGRSNNTGVSVKECVMCGKVDVCTFCAVLFDYDCNLDNPRFTCDYPNFCCEKCWDLGKSIREEIMTIRNTAEKKEDSLWLEWVRKVRAYNES